MRKVLLGLLASLLVSPAWAQSEGAGAPSGGTLAPRSILAGCANQTVTPTTGQQTGVVCDSNGNLKVNVAVGGGGGAVTVTQTAVTPTDRGGTLTLGGTAQNAAASNASRKGFLIQNPCTTAGEGGIGATEDLYVSVTGAATVAGATNYADLAPCGSATLILATGTVIQAAVSVNAATTGHRWSATEVQ